MIKRLSAVAFALSLLGGASALAQPVPPHGGSGGGSHGGGGGGGGSHGGAPGGGGPHGGPVGGGAPHGGPVGGVGVQGGGAPGGTGGSAGNRAGVMPYVGGLRGGPPAGGGSGGIWRGGSAGAGGPGGTWHGGAGGPAGGWRGGPGGFHPGFGAPGFNPGGPRPRYSPQFFPRVFYPEQRFHWRGEWLAPPGFYYRHWGYGDRLPWGWYDQQYWMNDYYDYDLPVPPYGFEWIRLGADAVLVDLSSGMVVETVYGAFY